MVPGSDICNGIVITCPLYVRNPLLGDLRLDICPYERVAVPSNILLFSLLLWSSAFQYGTRLVQP